MPPHARMNVSSITCDVPGVPPQWRPRGGGAGVRIGDVRRGFGSSHEDHGRVLHRQGGREHGAGGRDLGSFAGENRGCLIFLFGFFSTIPVIFETTEAWLQPSLRWSWARRSYLLFLFHFGVSGVLHCEIIYGQRWCGPFALAGRRPHAT